MADEELDLDLDDNNEDITRKDNRIKNLSSKVKETSEERDRLAKEKEEATTARAEADKERDFYKGFNQVSSKYQGSSEYQDKIWEKVKSGYDVEDATISIMAKEGKYVPPAPVIQRESAAGGSAASAMVGDNSKSADEMSQEERRKTLLDLELKGEKFL